MKSSKDGKNRLKKFQGLELSWSNSSSGAALIVTLWVIMILSLLISQFAFDMRIEGGIASHYRKLIKAQYLARAGVEWAKVMLSKKVDTTSADELKVEDGDDEEMVMAAYNLSRGVGLHGVTKQLGEGTFKLDILPEEGRRNVNLLSDEDWEEILDQGNVPEEQWPELIDCFHDWTDADDVHLLNGAESDDPYYKQRGYECKNAPLDTVDELLMIKGFTEGILYGEPAKSDKDQPLIGIAPWLTTWGDGKINVNSASKEVLMTLKGMTEDVVNDIINGRAGHDGKLNTKDDGWESVDEVVSKTGMDPALKDKLTTTERQFIRITSIGEVQNVRSGIWCILQVTEGSAIPVFWREEAMP